MAASSIASTVDPDGSVGLTVAEADSIAAQPVAGQFGVARNLTASLMARLEAGLQPFDYRQCGRMRSFPRPDPILGQNRGWFGQLGCCTPLLYSTDRHLR
jgi:hypothetical protein